MRAEHGSVGGVVPGWTSVVDRRTTYSVTPPGYCLLHCADGWDICVPFLPVPGCTRTTTPPPHLPAIPYLPGYHITYHTTPSTACGRFLLGTLALTLPSHVARRLCLCSHYYPHYIYFIYSSSHPPLLFLRLLPTTFTTTYHWRGIAIPRGSTFILIPFTPFPLPSPHYALPLPRLSSPYSQRCGFMVIGSLFICCRAGTDFLRTGRDGCAHKTLAFAASHPLVQFQFLPPKTP